MSVPQGFEGLRFPCECVSSRAGGYSDPWASVTRNKLLPDGTKEEIINLLAQEPMTISQMAERLNLSAPSVHAHVSEMLKSELLREAVEWEKTHQAERYYEPNFPIIKEGEAEKLCGLCDDLAAKVADIFRKHRRKLEKSFGETPLAEQGWDFGEVAQFVFASVQRTAREMLEEEGILSPAQTHRNGAAWVFWAEQPATDSDDK